MSWEMENAAMPEGGSPASSRNASPVKLPSDPRKGTYVGLRNQGSTCYLNSLLQCLFFTRELREAILSCNNCDSSIVCQLKKLFKKLKLDKSAPSTKGITKCLGVRNVHQQQDVAEYFRILMNKIVEEKEEIQPLYQVKMVHSITCQGCGQQTRIQQNPVLSLALSLDKYTSNCEVYSVHNALDAVQKVNEFTDDKFYCETCRSKQEATSGCHFETLPQILVLNLKRYQFDGDQFKKPRYEVSVPFSLTVNSEEQPNTQYVLFAICHHSGGIYGGHYMAEIKSFENDSWYSFNDTTVNKVQEEWNTTGAKNSSTAYLLMYRMANCDAKPKADNSRMQIAHFIDEGMTLENPTRVRSFHAMLENSIGVFWRRENSDQQTQLHSIVLLYQAQRRVNLTLHLYLIPDDGSRIKAVKDYEKECQSWFVSKSHFTAKPLCFGSFYIVSSPSEITVTPKELPFLDKPAETFQPFTEVHTTDVKKELELSLVEKKDGKPIWEAVIRPEDLAPSVSSIKMQIDTHFVDQHREQLIKRVTSVDGILDSLHGIVLDIEQYQSVRAERTNADKMRKLYELVPSWNSDCKEKLYQALKDKHRHLVEELEEK